MNLVHVYVYGALPDNTRHTRLEHLTYGGQLELEWAEYNLVLLSNLLQR